MPFARGAEDADGEEDLDADAVADVGNDAAVVTAARRCVDIIGRRTKEEAMIIGPPKPKPEPRSVDVGRRWGDADDEERAERTKRRQKDASAAARRRRGREEEEE